MSAKTSENRRKQGAKPVWPTLMGDKKRPFLHFVSQTLGNVMAVGYGVSNYAEILDQNGAIHPQKQQKWYNKVGRYPLWITRGAAAVTPYEGLKQTYDPNRSDQQPRVQRP